MRQRTVLVVVYDGVGSLDVTGPVEVFSWAGRLHGEPYDIRVASLDGRAVRTSSGLTLIPDCALGAADVPHTLLVPGGDSVRRPDSGLVDWLRRYAPRAERMVSVSGGALLLAAAGLLDGHRATTHWTLCDHLARTHPAVQVHPDRIFVRDGRLATSAGATTGVDLALALVEEDLGRDTALVVARYLVVYLRRSGNQAQLSTLLAARTAASEPLREVQRWITDHPDADLSVRRLAERASLSPRHFARVFRSQTGVTPGRYVEGVRLEHARRLLEETACSVAQISRTCGYGTPEAMRRAFVRALGTTPVEYRHGLHPNPGPTPRGR